MHAIPTNIITGFLGSGKTTAILKLLERKPANERWAVLVNEFGEIGIDGALLKNSGAYVKEIPGGCMCCVVGLPMQIGLNRLLKESQPDRLLIEPTGLGHPDEVIQTLTQAPFNEVLDLKATLTLVDPRKLSDPRYTGNDNFLKQITVADVLVASKQDLASDEDMTRFVNFADTLSPSKAHVAAVSHGELQLQWLDLPREIRPLDHHHHHVPVATSTNEDTIDTLATPDRATGMLRRQGKGQGFSSCGWVFHPDTVFSFDALFGWLTGFDCQRLKAVMITDKGVFAFNAENGVLSVYELDDCLDSRIEIIHPQALDWDSLEKELDAMRLT